MRILLLIFTLVTAGCNYNHVKEPADANQALLSQESFATPDYKTMQENLIGPRCLSCHSAAGGNQGGTNLESYTQVRALLNRIAFRALEKKDMPPGGLPGQSGQLLQNWIDSGAPETVSVVNEKPDPSLGTGPNDWPKVRDKIFAKKCNACHSGANPLGGIDLTDIKAVRAAAMKIFDRVIVVGDMPVAPYPAMTPKERKVMLAWFDAGMPE